MGLPGRLLPWFVTKKRERKERKRRKEGGEGVTSLVWRSVTVVEVEVKEVVVVVRGLWRFRLRSVHYRASNKRSLARKTNRGRAWEVSKVTSSSAAVAGLMVPWMGKAVLMSLPSIRVKWDWYPLRHALPL